MEEDGSLLEIGMFRSYFHYLSSISDKHCISPCSYKLVSDKNLENCQLAKACPLNYNVRYCYVKVTAGLA